MTWSRSGLADEDPTRAVRRVLVVDDEPVIRRLLRRLLTETGYDVLEAADGAEALAFVQEAPELLDLVVSDIVMPRLNGIELLQSLGILCPDLPCILISAYNPAQLAGLGFAAPCGVLPKPLQPEAFLEEVRRCLRQRK